MGQTKGDEILWQEALRRLRDEAARLPQAERDWMTPRLEAIAQLQGRIHALFEKAGGEGACRACGGGCCEHGKHHVTLVNLLPFFLSDEAPPHPDFASTCPFLGEGGCRLKISRRPFNCVTFICDTVEESLAEAEQAVFYRLEKELRTLYETFDLRYAGSSLRGFLIRAKRLGRGAFFENP